MIDDKKIEEATRDYINKNGYFVKYDEDPCVDIEFAYKEGAKWAINEFLKDLWHPASEKPEGYDEWILIHYNVGNYYSLAQVKDFKSWKGFVERVPIENWLYIDDLFPKEGDKNEGV